MAAYRVARIAHVRNAGIDAAAGDYVCQVDSDNTIDPDHVETLLHSLIASDATVSHCHKKLLQPDGTPYTLPLHPWIGSADAAALAYRELEQQGIYTSGTNLCRDRVEVGLDANEFFMRTEDFRRLRFREDYSQEEMDALLGEDDDLSARLVQSGVRVSSTGRFTLNFYLGGLFTTELRD